MGIKTKIIQFRVSEEEAVVLETASQSAGFENTSAYLRYVVLTDNIKGNADFRNKIKELYNVLMLNKKVKRRSKGR